MVRCDGDVLFLGCGRRGFGGFRAIRGGRMTCRLRRLQVLLWAKLRQVTALLVLMFRIAS